jgi:hypothetical protein
MAQEERRANLFPAHRLLLIQSGGRVLR